MTKVLFVLKYREDPYADYSGTSTWGDEGIDRDKKLLSSGLYNSARMIVEMLIAAGLEAKLVHVVDNNSIHREVVNYGLEPGGSVTHVVVEAFWVVPEKFEELAKVLPNVQWIVRNHSESPFLANEGIAFDWALRYVDYENVSIACNAPRMLEEMRYLVKAKHPNWGKKAIERKVPFLPNYYPLDDYRKRKPWGEHEYLDVGCFGAIRPLKNHVTQAIAAIKFAELLGRRLRFHINGTRLEGGSGDSIRKNLRGIFSKYDRHELVEHSWKPHKAFRYLVSQMDLVLQVSFSETFNIVAADAVSQDVPVISSKEVAWINPIYHADPTSSQSIVDAMERAWYVRWFFWELNLSLSGLKKYNRESKEEWLTFFGRRR